MAERYLRGLARVNSGQGHDARVQLGNLTLQIGLVAEILKRADAGDPEVRKRLDQHLDKAARAARELHQALERILAATRTGDGARSLDLREALQEIEALLGPMLKERQIAMSVQAPENSVALDGDRDAIRQVLLVALVEACESIPDGGKLELRLDLYGTLTVIGAAPSVWAGAVSGIVEDIGGAVTSDGRPEVEIRLPIQARTP